MAPPTRVTKGLEKVVVPAANFGLNFVSSYHPPQIEFRAARVKEDPAELEKAAETLKQAGAIVLRGFYSTSQIDRLRGSVEPFFEEAEQWRNADPKHLEDQRVLVQNGVRKTLNGYGSILKHPKPVLNFRIDEDAGLVDLFHPERIFEPQGAIGVADPNKESLVQTLLERAFSCHFKTSVRNLYLNDSVVRTRGFHIDGLDMKSKNFLYLTDVGSDEDGPYSYALGTHRASKRLRAANLRYNASLGRRWDDFPLHASRRRVVFHGERGDLIISMQFGAHRGLPQHWNRRRIVLVHTVAEVKKARAEVAPDGAAPLAVNPQQDPPSAHA